MPVDPRVFTTYQEFLDQAERYERGDISMKSILPFVVVSGDDFIREDLTKTKAALSEEAIEHRRKLDRIIARELAQAARARAREAK
jgi:hypothetical protein